MAVFLRGHDLPHKHFEASRCHDLPHGHFEASPDREHCCRSRLLFLPSRRHSACLDRVWEIIPVTSCFWPQLDSPVDCWDFWYGWLPHHTILRLLSIKHLHGSCLVNSLLLRNMGDDQLQVSRRPPTNAAKQVCVNSKKLVC